MQTYLSVEVMAFAAISILYGTYTMQNVNFSYCSCLQFFQFSIVFSINQCNNDVWRMERRRSTSMKKTMRYSCSNNNNKKNWPNEAYEYTSSIWESECLKLIFKVVTCICRASSTIFARACLCLTCSRAVPSITNENKKNQNIKRKTKHTDTHCVCIAFNAEATHRRAYNVWISENCKHFVRCS